eukprot:m.239683 g.239683  ORF g.239683 m.239683 type:complete len:267 (-) comp13521_c0_seq1:99-899(-)
MTIRVLAALMLATCAAAWGPVTHQILGCEFADCTSATNGSFVLGKSSPDAFLTESDLTWVHSFDFAAWMLAYGIQNEARYRTATFDPTQFSRGFFVHLIEDQISHHANGYLPAAVEPMLMLEYHVDALMYMNDTRFDLHVFSNDGLVFYTAALNNYASAINKTLNISLGKVRSLIDEYQDGLKSELKLFHLDNYKDGMVKGDTCHYTTFDQAFEHLQLSLLWGHAATVAWLSMADSGVAPAASAAAIVKYVDNQFAGHGGTSCLSY